MTYPCGRKQHRGLVSKLLHISDCENCRQSPDAIFYAKSIFDTTPPDELMKANFKVFIKRAERSIDDPYLFIQELAKFFTYALSMFSPVDYPKKAFISDILNSIRSRFFDDDSRGYL